MTGFMVRLAGEDNVAFRCAGDDTLLRGALREGLGFPYECNVGACGTCRFELLEGSVNNDWPDAPGLSERDRRRGRMLACQVRPTSDCTISLRLDDNCAPATRPSRRAARLMAVEPVTHDIAEFHLQCDGPAEFLAGQYALFRMPGLDKIRAYSMSNLANAEGRYSFLIKRVRGGQASGILFDRLKIGERIDLDGPYGLAHWRAASGRDPVCIAGGSGLSPMISIARAFAADPASRGRRLRFFYGGRTVTDICGEDMIRALPQDDRRIDYCAAVSDPTADDQASWRGPRGFIHDVAEQRMGGDFAAHDYYLAGPPPMVKAALEMLASRHRVPVSQIFYDNFH